MADDMELEIKVPRQVKSQDEANIIETGGETS